MRLSDLNVLSESFKGQTAVGSKLISYRTAKRGNTFHITVASQGKSIGSIKVSESKVSFTDHRGKTIVTLDKTFDDLTQRLIKSSLIVQLINILDSSTHY